MANPTEEIYDNLSKVIYSDFNDYVLQILKATNTPGITMSRIVEKSQEFPNDPIRYFDRAVFAKVPETATEENLAELIGKLQKVPLLVFCISKKAIFARNTRTNEEVHFPPNDISSHLLFLLPLIQGVRVKYSSQETWKFAELITVLRNKLIKSLTKESEKELAPTFILELIKAGIASYFVNDSKVRTAFKLIDQESSSVKAKNYVNFIADYSIDRKYTEPLLKAFLLSSDNQTLSLVKSVFLYDYSEIDSEILGSIIYRIVNAEAGVRSHMVSEENALKIIGPLLVEPYLIELTKLPTGSSEYESLLKKVLNFYFLDPTNGTGNLLASAMSKIVTFISITSQDKKNFAGLKIENFAAISEDPIGAEISRIIIWFSYLNLLHTPGSVAFNEIEDNFKKVNVVQDNPLTASWRTPLKKSLPDFIFGVPTFKGWHKMSDEEKGLFRKVCDDLNPSNLDFSAAWLVRSANLIQNSETEVCFGLTNSLVQGKQVQLLWPNVFSKGVEIGFAYPSFKWINDPKQNTGVTAVIVSLRSNTGAKGQPTIRQGSQVKKVKVIGPYLVEGITSIIKSRTKRPAGSQLPLMVKGNMPYDDGNLLLTPSEKDELVKNAPKASRFIKRIVGSDEFINAIERYCIWIPTENLNEAMAIKSIAERVAAVKRFRMSGKDKSANKLAEKAHQFREFRSTTLQTLVIPSVSSENRKFIPIGFVNTETIVSNLSFAIYECQPWVLPILSSSMHMVWARTTCGNLETRIRYSSQLCYNTFPLPVLSQDQQKELSKLAFDLISCREKFFDKSLGEMYSKMPNELEKLHLLIDQFVDGIYGLTGSSSDQDRLRKLLQIYSA